MFTAVSTWSFPRPEDVERFEQHYWDVHVRLARDIPGTLEITLMRSSEALPGEESAFYRTVVMSWPSREVFDAATTTPQWDALRADSAAIIEEYGVSLLTGMGEPQAVEMPGER